MTQDFAKRIEEAKRAYGGRLSILAHHYQDDAVTRHADHVGDSLELARKIPDLTSEYIVFCGVYFMAETAAILAKPGQKIIIPAMDSKCVMSEMAPASLAEKVFSRLDERGGKVLGLTYVNSSAAVKALCGATGGSVCTSANAERMLSWALDQDRRVVFLPDRMLAQNTCDKLGVGAARRHILDIRRNGENLDLAAAERADVLIWPGRCVIHSRFKPEDIRAIRKSHPGALVVVHPECSPETVAEADASGSTSLIIRFVADAPKGSLIYIGTEISLVSRLAKAYQGEKTILPITRSLCSNMAKNTEEKLAEVLSGLPSQPAARVAPAIAGPALTALSRMLTACA